mgnify:CR=1 FL=1
MCTNREQRTEIQVFVLVREANADGRNSHARNKRATLELPSFTRKSAETAANCSKSDHSEHLVVGSGAFRENQQRREFGVRCAILNTVCPLRLVNAVSILTSTACSDFLRPSADSG